MYCERFWCVVRGSGGLVYGGFAGTPGFISGALCIFTWRVCGLKVVNIINARFIITQCIIMIMIIALEDK